MKKRVSSLAIVAAFSGGLFVIQSNLCTALAVHAPDPVKKNDIKKQAKTLVGQSFMELQEIISANVLLDKKLKAFAIARFDFKEIAIQQLGTLDQKVVQLLPEYLVCRCKSGAVKEVCNYEIPKEMGVTERPDFVVVRSSLPSKKDQSDKVDMTVIIKKEDGKLGKFTDVTIFSISIAGGVKGVVQNYAKFHNININESTKEKRIDVFRQALKEYISKKK